MTCINMCQNTDSPEKSAIAFGSLRDVYCPLVNKVLDPILSDTIIKQLQPKVSQKQLFGL